MNGQLLSLEWEEGLFVGLRALARRLRRASARAPEPPGRVQFAQLEPVLGIVARMLAGEPLQVQAAEAMGGLKGRYLLLPGWLDLAPEPAVNRDLYVLRTAVGAMQRRLMREAGLRVSPAADAAALFVLQLTWVRRAVDRLHAEFAAFSNRWRGACALCLERRPQPERLRGADRLLEETRQALLRGEGPPDGAALADTLRRLSLSHAQVRRGPSPAVPLWGELYPEEGDAGALGIPADIDRPETSAGTEIQAPPKDHVEMVQLDRRDIEDSVLMHVFEKAETADEYAGGARNLDGSDDLEAHLEALQELDLRQMVRGGERAHSIYRAGMRMSAEIPDAVDSEAEAGIRYDEWDARRRRYRRRWCTVYPTRAREAAPEWAPAALQRQQRLVRRLHDELLVHRRRFDTTDRRADGEEVDLSAVVDDWATRRAGHTGSENLYLRRERRRRDFATTVLLDLSLSSDAWVDDRRVLDISREAVLVLGEVAERLGDDLEVLAFASKTRNCCWVWTVRDRREPWAAGRRRLGALRPQGYTRIGPALRHAVATIETVHAERKLVLLVSDGKPNDYDRYEGAYGVGDVRMAIREAERNGVHTHALAVDSVARDYLPSMFGQGAWDIMMHPRDMVDSLTRVYGRLTRG